jgi:small-conductance mechanosensitive channel
MKMNIPFLHFSFSSGFARSAFTVSFTLLVAVILDNILRLFIKLPKHFETRRSRTYVTIVRNSITVLVYAVALHAIFLELGINITPLLASAGIIGVIVGIGARSIVEDFISGVFLLSQDSIAVGDYIRIDTDEGYIENIGFRTLSVRGDDGALYVIPNGQVKRVVNFSRHRSHVFVDITLKADQKIENVLSVMRDALTELQEDPTLTSSLYPGSSVNGIENYTADGRMVVRTTIIIAPILRYEAARKYRYLVKKGFEAKKLIFG